MCPFLLDHVNPTWQNSRVYDALLSHNVAFCIYELDGYRSPMEVTADFVYIRLHGPNGRNNFV